jgi:hypothetical protein
MITVAVAQGCGDPALVTQAVAMYCPGFEYE